MVKYKKPEFDRILYALSDPTRRAILDELYRGPRSIGELAQPFRMSLPAISKHIKILKGTGLISTSKAGQRVMCNLESAALLRVATWLARYQKLWETRLSVLKDTIHNQRFDQGTEEI